MEIMMAKFWEAIIESCVLYEDFPLNNHYFELRHIPCSVFPQPVTIAFKGSFSSDCESGRQAA